MEALAVFALACNVLQVIDTGCRVATTLKQVHRTGTTEEHTILASNAESLTDATTKLQSSIIRPVTKDEDELCAIAQRCANIAAELEQKAAPAQTTRKRDKWKKLQTIWTNGEVDKLVDKLESYRKVLDNQILVSLRKQFNVLTFEQLDGFEHLELTLRDFFRQQADVQKQESDKLSQLIRSEGQKITKNIQQDQLDASEKQRYDKLILSLVFPSMNARKNQITTALDNTCEWIFEPPDNSCNVFGDSDHYGHYGHYGESTRLLWDGFGEWLRTDSTIYWISGKAGSGKSTLMKRLYNHETTHALLKQWGALYDVYCLEAYLWDAGSEAQKSLRGLLATLLVQVLQVQPRLGELLLNSQSRLQQKVHFEDWSEAELHHSFTFLIRSIDDKFCLFIDGLDEARSTKLESSEAVIQFVLDVSSFPNIKSCVSSRPLRDYEIVLQEYPKLRLEYLNGKDIETLYLQNLEPLLRSTGIATGYDIGYFRQEFRRKACGVFLWARLAIESLKQGVKNLDSFEELKKRLELLPSELQDLYELMWRRNADDHTLYREQTSIFLRLRFLGIQGSRISVLHYTLSLPQNEWLRVAAMAGEVHEKLLQTCSNTEVHLKTRCAGMLEIIPADSDYLNRAQLDHEEHDNLNGVRFCTVDFIHRTVKDFLLTTPFGQGLLKSKFMDAELVRWLFDARLCEMSMFSRRPSYDVLSELLHTIHQDFVTAHDELSMLLAMENTCTDMFLRTSREFETVGNWLFCPENEEAGRGRQSWNQEVIEWHSCLDFVALTIRCGFDALVKHYLNTPLKIANPSYAKYCLLSWDLWYMHHRWESRNKTEEEEHNRVEEHEENLLSTLLRLSRAHDGNATQKTEGFDEGDLFFVWNEKYAFRTSLNGYLGVNLVRLFASWTNVYRMLKPILKYWLDSQSNIDDRILLYAHECEYYRGQPPDDRDGIISMSSFEGGMLDGSKYHNIIFECSVLYLIKCTAMKVIKSRPDHEFQSMLAKLNVMNDELRIRTLWARDANESTGTPFVGIKEEDSVYFTALLQDVMESGNLQVVVNFDSFDCRIEASRAVTFNAEINKVLEIGQQVDIFAELKEAGWIIDKDDPRVMRCPPPMYLEDAEVSQTQTVPTANSDGMSIDNDQKGMLILPIRIRSSSSSSSHSDLSEDKFFETEEGL